MNIFESIRISESAHHIKSHSMEIATNIAGPEIAGELNLKERSPLIQELRNRVADYIREERAQEVAMRGMAMHMAISYVDSL